VWSDAGTELRSSRVVVSSPQISVAGG